MMQTMAMMSLVTIQWFLIGYSLAFGKGKWIGGLEYFCWNNVTQDPNAYYAAAIPHQLWAIYQLMFAIITPALITGAFAERMKFSSCCVFLLLWSTLIYDPLAHAVWGEGGMLKLDTKEGYPALDFAGGAVVHLSSGVSALICALYLGRRRGFPKEPMPPHNMTYSVIGAGLLWFGWFGFNGGSALEANGLAVGAFVATHFAAAAAALGWSACERVLRGKASALGAISGAVTGLVVITPACGFVTPASAVFMGLLGGVFCFIMCTTVKNMFGYDDSLDAFGVHGAGGLLGAILTGVFATKAVNAAGADGLLAGNATQLLNQAAASIATIVYAGGVTLGLLFVVDKLMGLRVGAEAEAVGLDLAEHGESGYHD
jgi:Amt family ammonium transporter